MNASINEPEAITHYPTAGANVVVVASNKLESDTSDSTFEAGIFSVSLFYLDLAEDSANYGLDFGEHLTISDTSLNTLPDNY